MEVLNNGTEAIEEEEAQCAKVDQEVAQEEEVESPRITSPA
jgi:hypothetical protein